ncbi:hypothetical protein M9H77_00394 [Catharanthus roseus]|nr:hypothetical protein M9H77_00394 [Catharanthus roseus]
MIFFTKNVCLFFIRPYGQDIQVKLFFLSECLALVARELLMVHINPQVSLSECLAPVHENGEPSATVDAVIFLTKNVCLFFIRPYGQDIQVKLFYLVHINPQVSLSECLAPVARKR